MGILSIFKRKPPNVNHDFTDRDREVSKEKRELKYKLDMELMQLEQAREKLLLQADIERVTQELQELRGDYEDEPSEGGNMEDKLLTLLLAKFLGGQQQTPVIPPIQPVESLEKPLLNLTDDQLKDIWHKMPKNQRQIAKGMSDDQLRTVIISQMPNVDKDTLDRAIAMVRK